MRTEELRKMTLLQLEWEIELHEREHGKNDTESVKIDYATAKWAAELLKVLEVRKDGTWLYYTNDEGKPRWKCDQCGKICHRDPHDKNYCSNCGSKNVKEA